MYSAASFGLSCCLGSKLQHLNSTNVGSKGGVRSVRGRVSCMISFFFHCFGFSLTLFNFCRFKFEKKKGGGVSVFLPSLPPPFSTPSLPLPWQRPAIQVRLCQNTSPSPSSLNPPLLSSPYQGRGLPFRLVTVSFHFLLLLPNLPGRGRPFRSVTVSFVNPSPFPHFTWQGPAI